MKGVLVNQSSNDNLKCFDTGRLEVLRAVAAAGSLTGAARSLTYTVSAVSQQMARLEREVGVQLVVRLARGVVLTDAGRVMVRHADEVRSSAGLARARLRSLRELDNGHVRVASAASFTATVLPKILRPLQLKTPALTFEVHSAKIDELVEMVARYDVDLGVVWRYTGDRPAIDIHLDIHPLFKDTLCVALPIEHSLAGRSPVSLRDLSDDVIITPRHTYLLSALRSLVFDQPLRQIQEANDYQEAQGLASAGLGVAIIPALVARTHHNGVAVSRLVPGELPDRNFVIALSPLVKPSPSCAALIDALKEHSADAE